MTLEQRVLLAVWLFSLASIAFLVDRRTIRRFAIAAMTAQAATWLAALLHVKLGLLRFPIREFPVATAIGFSTEYILYPVLTGLYVVYEPKQRWPVRLLYLLGFSMLIATIHRQIALHTKLLDYVRYHWSFAVIVSLLFLTASRLVTEWFFRSPERFRADKAKTARSGR